MCMFPHPPTLTLLPQLLSVTLSACGEVAPTPDRMGPYARVDYNLTLCQLQHIHHGQPNARVDIIPKSGTGFGLRT
jgi:hypothetical protein